MQLESHKNIQIDLKIFIRFSQQRDLSHMSSNYSAINGPHHKTAVNGQEAVSRNASSGESVVLIRVIAGIGERKSKEALPRQV